MPIHEKSLIRPENIKTHDKLVIEGVDVSGHWSTFIESRAITDYNEAMEDEISALPGGEYIHRCWQCGSCTNSCTVHAIEERFNPRYWIYLIRTGMEQELLRDKDIIWQCVSCNKCVAYGVWIAQSLHVLGMHLLTRRANGGAKALAADVMSMALAAPAALGALLLTGSGTVGILSAVLVYLLLLAGAAWTLGGFAQTRLVVSGIRTWWQHAR